MKALMLGARTLAILIAVVATIDPAVTSPRHTKPEVAVVSAAGSGVDSSAFNRVVKELDDDYKVIRGPYANAAGTVIVGNGLPADRSELAAPVFGLTPDRAGIAIEQVSMPSPASIEARVPIAVKTRVRDGVRTVDVTLSVGGLVVDRTSRITNASGSVSVPISFVPTSTGLTALRIVARVAGTADSTAVDLAVEVRDARWAVLFFDRRPSWMSTFVRRSLEADRRFVVASRVMTSKRISTDAGQPPSSLEDPTLLELYDAIVVGAPEALTARDVEGLEGFLRRRGGGVVLLFDARPKGGVYDRLTGVSRWSGSNSAVALSIAPSGSDSSGLRATDLAWPATAPAVSDTMATVLGGGASKPIVWTTPVGSGQLIINGALDSWKFRDPATSGFDRFWRSAIARAAAGAMPAIEATVARSIVTPGEMIDLTVGVRDARLPSSRQTARASVTAAIESDGAARTEIRMWPTDRLGELAGSVRAPAAVGSHRIVVTANGTRVEVPVLVAAAVARVEPDESEAIAAFAGSRGGKLVPLAELAGALRSAVRAEPRVERWFPMRSSWWVVPFVVLLGVEWWWRRRRGLA